MRIDKIIINNFRVYLGVNEICFHQTKERNISLVAGKNGFGKTTFLTSLIWGLYGNQMSQVEEKYRTEIKNTGGYDAYLKSLVNHSALNDYETGQIKTAHLFVEIHIVDLMIPSIPCKELCIKRSFDFASSKENLQIIIDGQENELTKEVGFDVFINDFILPREIAKFFFFDAEKIVSLAEAKTKSELRSLSKAYSEVLGIKKYEDLKENLNALLSRLKRAGVSKKDEAKVLELESQREELQKMLIHLANQKQLVEQDIIQGRTIADLLQEQLIREGNEMSLNELKELYHRRDQIKAELESLKQELRKLMDFIPLAIAKNRFKELIDQIHKELKIKHSILDRQTLKTEYDRLQLDFFEGIKKITPDKKLIVELASYMKRLTDSRIREVSTQKVSCEILLDFDDETSRRILSTYDYIQNSFKTQFQQIVSKEKEVRQELGRISKKLREGEARKDNPLSEKLREDKYELDRRLEALEIKRSNLIGEIGASQNQEASVNKVLSEMLKKSKFLEMDKKKFGVTLDLLDKLNELITRIKEEKKYSLQKSILLGLKKLMHKKEKYHDVRVRIDDDVMDIDLIDQFGKVIDKDTLSKGEQQLYATALLKALVDESGIDFPVFIDSPLQKFDKEHSGNVIQQFYPSISDQVVLFPLLETEISLKSFELLKPHLAGAYLIQHSATGSAIEECQVDELFTKFDQQNVFTY